MLEEIIITIMDDLYTELHTTYTTMFASRSAKNDFKLEILRLKTKAQNQFLLSSTLTKDMCPDFFMHCEYMLSMYPKSFRKSYNVKTNVCGLLAMLPTISLKNYQKNLFLNRYIPFVIVLEKRQNKYRILYFVSNSIVHTTSILLPGMITFGDLYNTRNQDIKHSFHIMSIILSLSMSVVANFIILYKINQKFSIYLQYYRTMKHEIWKMITMTGQYEAETMDDKIFKTFSATMEKFIEELHNFEYEFTLSTSKSEDIGSASAPSPSKNIECDCECNCDNVPECNSHQV